MSSADAGLPDRSTLARYEEIAARHLLETAASIVAPTLGRPEGGHRWTSFTQVHTQADAEAGEALAAAFAASFPGHGLIVEDRPALAGDGEWEWFIDPIDGSANHLRGIPYVALTAGLRFRGEAVVGVVHDLVRALSFSAHRDGGARCRDAQGRVSPLSVAPTQRLQDAMLIAHLSRRGPLVNLPGVLQTLLWSVRKIRCMGSIALDLALIASGEADLLVVGRGHPQRLLDIVGGLVVLEEAGGVVLTADGEPVDDTTRTLLAGPPALCHAAIERLASFPLEAWTADQARPPD